MDQEQSKNRIAFSPYRITDIFIYVMLAGLPLWFDRGGYTNLTTSKYLFFAVATGIWLILVTVSALVRKEKISMSADKWIVVFLVIVAFLSSLFSPYQEDVWMGSGRYNGFLTIVMYGILYLGVSSYGSPKMSYIAVLITSLAVCSIVGIFQLLGYNPFHLFPGDWNYYDKGIYYSSEFLGNVGNVDLFGALLSAAIPAAVAAALFGNGKSSLLMLIPVSLCLFVGLEIWVSSMILGLLTGFAVVVFLCVRKKDSVDKGRILPVIIVLLLTVLLSALISFQEGKATVGIHRETAVESTETQETNDLEKIAEGDWEKAGSSRLGIWKMLLDTVPEYPWLGSGPGSTAKRAEMVFERYVPETGNTLKARVDNAHNEYLEYLVGEGILGLTLYLLLIIFTIRRFRKETDAKKIMLIPAMAGYWVQSFFGLGLVLVLPVVYIFWALVASKKEE